MKVSTNSRDIGNAIHGQYMSVSQISDELGISRATFYRRLRRVRKPCSKRPSIPRGRPRKISNTVEQLVLKHIRRNPFLTIQQLLTEIGMQGCVGRVTMGRLLHRLGYRSRRPSRKPYLSRQHRAKRTRFVRQYRDIDWKEVVFSDEKRFGLRTDAPPRVWRQQGQRHAPENTTQTEKFAGGTVMVWAAIRSDGRLWVYRCTDRMDRWEYQNVLEKAMDGGLMHWPTGTKVRYFQHDGARPHQSAYTRAFFRFNDTDLLDWPPQSPDLNPMEHVWPMISREIGKHRFPSKDALWEAIQQACQRLSGSDSIRKLYESMDRRLQQVAKRHGGSTSY